MEGIVIITSVRWLVEFRVSGEKKNGQKTVEVDVKRQKKGKECLGDSRVKKNRCLEQGRKKCPKLRQSMLSVRTTMDRSSGEGDHDRRDIMREREGGVLRTTKVKGEVHEMIQFRLCTQCTKPKCYLRAGTAVLIR